MDADDSNAETRHAQRPDSLKLLRACKTCKLIKTAAQFYASYCENCPFNRPDQDNAGMKEDFVQSFTTTDFEGCGISSRFRV